MQSPPTHYPSPPPRVIPLPPLPCRCSLLTLLPPPLPPSQDPHPLSSPLTPPHSVSTTTPRMQTLSYIFGHDVRPLRYQQLRCRRVSVLGRQVQRCGPLLIEANKRRSSVPHTLQTPQPHISITHTTKQQQQAMAAASQQHHARQMRMRSKQLTPHHTHSAYTHISSPPARRRRTTRQTTPTPAHTHTPVRYSHGPDAATLCGT